MITLIDDTNHSKFKCFSNEKDLKSSKMILDDNKYFWENDHQNSINTDTQDRLINDIHKDKNTSSVKSKASTLEKTVWLIF